MKNDGISIQKNSDWLNELDPKSWLLEEYKLLSQHYFHEDNSLRKTISTYITINSALVAFLSSSFVANKLSIHLLISVIGIILCITWLGTLIREREWRNYIERRIGKIEHTLHDYWVNNKLIPLDIRAELEWDNLGGKLKWHSWPYHIFRKIPSSIMHFSLPITFFIVWLMILIFKI